MDYFQKIISYLKCFCLFTFAMLFNVQCVQQTSHFASLSSHTQIPDRLYINFDRGHYESNGETAPLFQLSSMDELQTLANCGVNKGEDSVEDTYCIIDLNEADIAASQGGVDGIEGGIPLELNVPPEMCEYTTWMIPWHWNQPSGFGPTKIVECTVSSSGDNPETDTYILNNGEWKSNDTEEDVSPCERYPYNYDRSNEEGLANCCFGRADKDTIECTGNGTGCCSRVLQAYNTAFANGTSST